MKYDPARYWPDRYRRQGRNYVAKGGRATSAREQTEAVTPFLRHAVTGPRVLDFGCGPGRFRPVLEEGRTYTGVDLIPGLGTMPLGDSLPAESYDTVTALWVLHHIVDWDQYRHWVTQIYNALAPGGRLVVVDCNLTDQRMDAHMKPRGLEALASLAPWSRLCVYGEYDGHWMGWLEKPREGGSVPISPISTFVEISTKVEKRAAVDESSTSPIGLILGGGDCVWCDVGDLEPFVGGEWIEHVCAKPCFAQKRRSHRVPAAWPGPVIACNDVGCLFPGRLDHWCSLHPEKLTKWTKERGARGHPSGYITWSRKGGRADRQVKTWGGGASGLLDITVAYEIGCERVVLCGVPMTRSPHFVDSIEHQYGKIWSSASTHFAVWKKPAILARMRGRVKSMSGETRALLGEPTPEFLRLVNVEAA
jgi:SAM-dependent methyltransferase